jgi:amino acid adenylation domain-containing protein
MIIAIDPDDARAERAQVAPHPLDVVKAVAPGTDEARVAPADGQKSCPVWHYRPTIAKVVTVMLPPEEPEALVVHRGFEAQVKRTPDALALRFDDRALTYAQLNGWANAIAGRLLERGVGDRVGLYAIRSGECVAAMLGILKAGAAYVPLEAHLPVERLRLMAAPADLIVTVPPLRWELSDTPSLPVEAFDETFADLGDPDVPVDGDDLFYVPYTSGSTGVPKGVEVPHRAVRGTFQGADYGAWGPGETVLHHAALSWDAHLMEIYPALSNGGCVWVFPGDTRDPTSVVAFARTHRVSTLGLSTQAFNTVVSSDAAAFDWRPRLVVGGEVFQRDQLARVLEHTPDLCITNVYGPVECTLLATAHRVRAEDLGLPSIPIGREVGDRRVYVLDEAGDPVERGVAGEAYIGGPAVARGYLGQPRLTAERFVPDRFSTVPGARMYRTGDIVRQHPDGVFEFLGRDDAQVKLRGFRIELGEVDAALRSHPSIADAVTVVNGTGELARLVAYVVAASGHPIDATAIRGYLSDRLTSAMIPAVIVPLDRMPSTVSGKLDRRALPEPDNGSRYEEPKTPTELRVTEIWQQELRLARVGRHDDFFEVGGNSLVATRLVGELRAAFGAEVKIRHLYEAPVVAEFAALIDRLPSDGGS